MSKMFFKNKYFPLIYDNGTDVCQTKPTDMRGFVKYLSFLTLQIGRERLGAFPNTGLWIFFPLRTSNLWNWGVTATVYVMPDYCSIKETVPFPTTHNTLRSR